jgi:hypothetical protein
VDSSKRGRLTAEVTFTLGPPAPRDLLRGASGRELRAIDIDLDDADIAALDDLKPHGRPLG